MRPPVSLVILAMLALLLPACAAPLGRPEGGAGQPLDGVWRSDGYGWIYLVRGGQAQIFETTSISCLPRRSLDQLGPPEPDGTVRFGRRGVAVQTVRPGADGQAILRLLGTAADIDLLPLPELPSSCTRKMPDDPVTNFDVFWTTFAENYNSFGRKNVDWAAVRDRYRPLVRPDTDPDELYTILTEMIRPLGDAHTSIQGPGGKEFSGMRPGTKGDLSTRTATAAVDNHLREDLGVTDIETFARGKIAYADLPGDRGYLRITSFEEYSDDDPTYLGSKAELERALDTVFTPQRVNTWRGLLIDIRANSGGDDALVLELAGRMTNTPYPAFSKQPRNDPRDQTRYGRLRTTTVTPGEVPRYTGPVRLLTSDLTISAGETFIEAMMARTPPAERVGTRTQGVYADVIDRKLPNGWGFGLGNEEYYAPDGRSYEGVGIPPTITMPVFTRAELEQNQDSAIDTPW